MVQSGFSGFISYIQTCIQYSSSLSYWWLSGLSVFSGGNPVRDHAAVTDYWQIETLAKRWGRDYVPSFGKLVFKKRKQKPTALPSQVINKVVLLFIIWLMYWMYRLIYFHICSIYCSCQSSVLQSLPTYFHPSVLLLKGISFPLV